VGIDPKVSEKQVIQPGDKIGQDKISGHIAPLSFLVKAKKDLQKLNIENAAAVQTIRGLRFDKAVIHQAGNVKSFHWVYVGTIAIDM